MSRFHSYINNALQIIESYQGDIPFAIFLKQYFSKEKKFGSTDRKSISTICYNYFRTGLALHRKPSPENLLIATFLCSSSSSQLLDHLKPEWGSQLPSSLDEKLALINHEVNIENLFPFKALLSDVIDERQFSKSFLIQPDIFVRIRPLHRATTLIKIETSGIPFTKINESCCQFLPGTNIEKMASPDKEVIIQDYSSQQVLNWLRENKNIVISPKKNITIWDCCAASGGKSILVADILQGNYQLTVSDIRTTILSNLRERFKNAGIAHFHHFLADLTTPVAIPGNQKFDLIICDVPCTGSGTWSRTPEQLYFFKESVVEDFANRQKKIITNAASHLDQSGYFIYITCSVFKKENEDLVAFITATQQLKLVEMKILPGYEIKADTMFVAVFQKIN